MEGRTLMDRITFFILAYNENVNITPNLLAQVSLNVTVLGI